MKSKNQIQWLHGHTAVGICGRPEGPTQDLPQLPETEQLVDHQIHICAVQLWLPTAISLDCPEAGPEEQTWRAGPLQGGLERLLRPWISEKALPHSVTVDKFLNPFEPQIHLEKEENTHF